LEKILPKALVNHNAEMEKFRHISIVCFTSKQLKELLLLPTTRSLIKETIGEQSEETQRQINQFLSNE
jgi:hypothetical protein